MAVPHGKNAVLKIDDSSDTLVDISDKVNESSTSHSKETAETTAYGDASKTYIAGLRDGTLSFSGHFDSASGEITSVLTGVFNSDTELDFEYGPEGSSSGNQKITGAGHLTSLEISAPVGDKVSISAELQVSGGLTYGSFA